MVDRSPDECVRNDHTSACTMSAGTGSQEWCRAPFPEFPPWFVTKNTIHAEWQMIVCPFRLKSKPQERRALLRGALVAEFSNWVENGVVGVYQKPQQPAGSERTGEYVGNAPYVHIADFLYREKYRGVTAMFSFSCWYIVSKGGQS